VIAHLAPADLPKDGAHFDLPIVLALVAAIGAVPQDALEDGLAFGELGLDGAFRATAGVLPAAGGHNLCCWSDRRARANPCWLRGCLAYCRRWRPMNCSNCRW
jgi:predicted ATPase with chaperone activity